MRGRTVTAEQKRFHSKLAELGCVACRAHGRANTHISLHHIDGRTKPDAHWLVLALCSSHHQDDGSGTIAVHPWKARFEAEYGKQRDLLRECIAALLDAGIEVPQGALRAAGYSELSAALSADERKAGVNGAPTPRPALPSPTNRKETA